ncbi:ATP-binding protein [Seonamhaeicola marinus]|uniref:histidine kinase n=1 Tax=Seonamhaeicola marinus TaxID=1912246 RepID=A0A5D0IM56_9FLAO|nr:ATP-binding protein [Seonamhaeicola marinus]TYA84081.1 response regulator [Seonamhaeicola marinus]
MSQTKLYTLVFIFLFSAFTWAQKGMNDDPEIVQSNINGRIEQFANYLEKFNYQEAQRNLDEALRIAEENDLKKNLGIIYTLKGKLQLIIEEKDNAFNTLNKAIKILSEIKDDAHLADAYRTLGEVFISKGDYFQALDYLKSSKNLYEQESVDKGIAETLLLEGKTYILLKKYREARSVLEQSTAYAKKSELLKIQSEGLLTHAFVYNKLGDNEKAVELSNEGLRIAKANNFMAILNEGYLMSSNLHNNIGNYQLSRNYLKSHVKLKDSIRDLTRFSSTKDQETQDLLQTTIAENEKLKEQAKAEEEDDGVRNLITILSVALITILSLLTLSLYKNNNIRLKTNNMLHKKNGELIIAKEKAELASKTKANFLSTVTHELRTPLYAVTGLSNMLLEENPKPEQIQHLKSLKFSGDYLLTFINDILQINKIEANKVELEPEPFNLRKKINNIILALNNSAEDNNVKIHFEYDKNLPENFIADQIKISQILINLIGNSIKFTKDGDIWIRVYQMEIKDKMYTLRFEVEDNGIGISQEKQDNMFESFNQGSIQINRKYGGTGLGLSIVKGLIDILKGEIHVKSKLEVGTTFFFDIPLEFTGEKEAKEKKSSYFDKENTELDLTNVKILVVEDNKINQMITKKILTKMGLKCDIIDNGTDAVEMIKTNGYNLILMDIHMPGISGIEATKRVRSFDKELTIFALTAVTIEDKMHEFEEAGFTDIIPKPFKQEEFEKKLYNALAPKQDRTASA